ncbi:hypothetical protein [Streptomyces sp. NBC_00425]|uniref:hypothetical protein n=1 Tax=Streptomyces sp. NBC_00425 TaxID=2975740 RepID=UPI002E2452E1
MAQKSTDQCPPSLGGISKEHAACAAWVLGTIAVKYRDGRSGDPVDMLDFTVRMATAAYDLVGDDGSGDARGIARMARAAAGDVPDGVARGTLADQLEAAALRLGCEWGADGEPKLPIPGPRKPSQMAVAR